MEKNLVMKTIKQFEREEGRVRLDRERYEMQKI